MFMHMSLGFYGSLKTRIFLFIASAARIDSIWFKSRIYYTIEVGLLILSYQLIKEKPLVWNNTSIKIGLGMKNKFEEMKY